MATVAVLNDQGKKVSTLELNAAIFDLPSNDALIAQAVRVRLANANQGTANTKTRAEVSGGGRKPWRQKGTGRARHGSTRSPIWRGGGITHGPRAGGVTLSMPQKMRRKALFTALSEKARAEQLMVIEGISMSKAQTKTLAQLLATAETGRSTLLVLPEKMEALERSARNLSKVKTMSARVLHPYEVMHYQTVIFFKDSLAVFEDTFLKQGKTEAKAETPVSEPKKAVKSAATKAAPKTKKVQPKAGRPVDEADKEKE